MCALFGFYVGPTQTDVPKSNSAWATQWQHSIMLLGLILPTLLHSGNKVKQTLL